VSYLLDTCVISELVARQPDPAVVQWVDGEDENRLFLSVITIGEIQRGIERLPASARQSALRHWLDDELVIRFDGRVLPITSAVMLLWGQMTADLERQGWPMPAMDSLIAATCLHHGMALVTRNEDDFVHSGVTLVNPWSR